MRVITRFALSWFLPLFLAALLSFVTILELIDLFTNLVAYIDADLTTFQILHLQLLYLPKCVTYSLPIATLFAVAFSLGSLHASNELIALFGAGISLYRFVLPFVVCGLLFSGAYFFIEELLAIPSLTQKQELMAILMGRTSPTQVVNVTLVGEENRLVVHTRRYDDRSHTITRVLVYEKDEEGEFASRIEAERGTWDPDQREWVLQRVRRYIRDEEGNLKEESFEKLRTDLGEIQPEDFLQTRHSIDKMTLAEAGRWIQTLKRAGLPYREALTDYYKRISFAFTSFIVALLATSVAGRFKANALLLSLLLSLSIGVSYYVFQMVTTLFAKLGYLPPVVGAWLPVLVFFSGSILFFKYIART
ncbi:LptF/LptG family permease [Spirochaeta thermophila]|uniref:Permease YjgP/YjgQ family protein n=1 Tax=Winmispira thermophila (strain ATCC 49972 / DSM 6192 / RI 19.B1) TaxID=665571 RepID=E0RSR9_WINT6|nr:LptF/LptG family permease [Spirochaeta thermophila]ADN02056.1 permease YjgP/YjgQ family protein [Spirochaeta thermophila DSM 6192]